MRTAGMRRVSTLLALRDPDAGEARDTPSKTSPAASRASSAELGGFVVSGPTTVSEIRRRVGAGEYRVSAYGLDVPGMRWEVFETFDEEDDEPSDPASASPERAARLLGEVGRGSSSRAAASAR